MRWSILLFILLIVSVSSSALPHGTYSSFSSFEARLSISDSSLSVSDGIIFSTAYYSVDGDSWSSLPLIGSSHPSAGDWLLGSASVSIPDSTKYLVVYSCSLVQGGQVSQSSLSDWNCHGRTSQEDGFWQLHAFDSVMSAQQFLIDFGPTPTSKGYWNSIDELSGTFPLVDAVSGQTKASLVILTDFRTSDKSGVSSTDLGYPASVSSDNYFISRWFDHPLFEIRGLDPSASYNLTFFGTRKSYDGYDRIARFTIGDEFHDLVTADNLGNTVSFTNMFPDASGIITVEISVSPNSVTDNGYLTSLIVETGTAVSQDKCVDVDSDGYLSIVCGGQDCDDTNKEVYPGADEVCDDGIDNDCDGLTDEENVVICGNSCTVEVCDNGLDDDCDGLVDVADGDCSSNPTCVDGMKNGDEEGVDCGGSCSVCSIIDFPQNFCREVPSDRPLRILFLGNSFTSQGPIPIMVKELATSASFPTPSVDYNTLGGQNLNNHRNSDVSVGKVDVGNWDVVVLQDFSRRGYEDPEGLKNDVAWFYNRIKSSSPDATVVLYETWSYPASTNQVIYGFGGSIEVMQNAISSTYHEAAEIADDVIVAHVGDAWLEHLSNSNPFNLYFEKSDGSLDYHAGSYGRYLNALVIYSTIYQSLTSGVSSWQLSSSDADRLQSLVDGLVNYSCEDDFSSDVVVWNPAVATPPPPITGMTYYVDATKGNDNNVGSLGAPLKTFTKALSVAEEGDLFLFYDGEYGEVNIGFDGDVFSDWVTFKAVDGQSPSLTSLVLGSGKTDYTKEAEDVANKLFVRVEGFSVIPAVKIVGASHVQLVELTISSDQKPTSVAFPDGVSMRQSYDVLVENSDITYVGVGISTNYWSKRVYLRGNHIHDISHDGLMIVSTKDLLIENNHIHNLDDGLGDDDPNPDRLNRHSDGIHLFPMDDSDKNFMTNITIRGNLIYHVENSIIQWNPKLRDDGLPTHYDYLIENNLFGPGCDGYAVNMDSSMVIGDSFTFRHNTMLPLYGNAQDYVGVTGRFMDCVDNNARFRVQFTGRGGNGVYYPLDVYNNIFVKNGLYLQLAENSDVFDEGNVNIDESTIFSVDEFIDVLDFDGALDSDSVAINKGVIPASPLHPLTVFDKNGVLRDTQPDSGAVEFS